MLAWLKGLPFGHYIIMAAIGAAAFVWSDLVLTKQALEDQRELTEQWQNAAETLEAIDSRRTIIVQAGNDAEQSIRESEDADQPISPDIAQRHAAGINSVRDAGTDDASKHVVPRPRSPVAKHGDADSGRASHVLD